MPGLRISIAGLLSLVAMVALWLAGMRSASSLWTTAAATVTLTLLLTAVLSAVLREGAERIFWAGFALFGWSYLVMVNWDWVGGPFGHDLTAGLSDLAESLFPELPIVGGPPAAAGTQPDPTTPAGLAQSYALARAQQVKRGNFLQISRMALSLAFGVVGGVIAQVVAERRRAPPRPAAGEG